MEFGAFLDPRAIPQLLAVVLMLALAGALLATRFNDRVNRAFALFLVLRGFAMGLAALGGVEADPARSSYWARMGGYFHLTSYLALLAFLAIYPKRWRVSRHAWARAALVLGAVAIVVLYAIDKCIWVCDDAASGLTRFGPTAAISLALVLSIASLYLVREHLATPAGPRREALLIIGCVFVLNALFDGTRGLGDLLAAIDLGLASFNFVPSVWAWATFAASPFALLPALAAVVLLARAWSANGGVLATRGRQFFLGAALLALASGALVAFVTQGVLKGSWGIFVLGLWRISIPLAVTYAILRHQLFDIDVRVKWTLERGAVVSVFGAAFFIGSELLEKLIPLDGFILGLASAGLITLVLRPIERYAHKLADRVLPQVHKESPIYLAERKVDVYRAAVESALEDGEVSEKERSILERLRLKLGIGSDDATRVEASLGLRPLPRGASAA